MILLNILSMRSGNNTLWFRWCLFIPPTHTLSLSHTHTHSHTIYLGPGYQHLSLSHSHKHTHTLSFSFFFSALLFLPHTHTLSLSLSHTLFTWEQYHPESLACRLLQCPRMLDLWSPKRANDKLLRYIRLII